MNTETLSLIVSIIGVIISPAIAIFIGEEIRKRNYQKEREDRLLEKLIANRYGIGSSEFISALNSIDFVFSNNFKIKELVKNLHRAYINKESATVANQRIVELIYEICRYKNYNITEYEIQNLFIPIQSQVVPQNPVQNLPSTAGNGTTNEHSLIVSNSTTSITGGYPPHKETKEIERTISLGIPGWVNYTKKVTRKN